MGSCFSKNSVHDDQEKNAGSRSSKNRFEKTERKLGEKEAVATNSKKSEGNILETNKFNADQSSGEKNSSAARQLGGKPDSSLNVREAAAKAAENRYLSKQQQLEASKEKLSAASRLSRAEKRL